MWKEGELLEAEMELDYQQQASSQAAKVMHDMRGQLTSYVSQEEELCAAEESALASETAGALRLLNEAADSSGFLRLPAASSIRHGVARIFVI